LKILWYSWKDITNPAAGGAEMFTFEIAKRLVNKGHEITLFCSAFKSCKSEENKEGIKIIRDGGKYLVYLKAKKFFKKNGSTFDLVIDEINTRPFLTPKFVDKPIVVLIHQLAREFWWYETRFPVNVLGYYWLENHWLSNYRKIPTITVSESTKNDLDKLGFSTVVIVPEGTTQSPLNSIPIKEENPTLVFVARLKKTKLPDVAIKSFFILKKIVPNLQLWIIGDGPMRKKLERLAGRSPNIKFWGRLSNEKKFEMMGRAHVLIVPAIREGWGLVITEANTMGTPAVGYNVHGIRNAIQDNVNGIIVKENTPLGIAQSTLELIRDAKSLSRLSQGSLLHSKQFNWDVSADIFERYLKSFT
jgi:glycosyltransferase involved in cell wall biosynthesis